MTVVALRRPPPDPRQFQRCLLLAALLHVWLVLMFGNAAGTAAPGQGVWGSLTVKLVGRSGAQSDAAPGDASSATPPRQSSPAAPAEPGAAAVGHPNPQQVPPEAARTEEPSPAPPSTATLELPEGFRPVERQDLSPAPRSAPLQMPTPELPAATLGRLEALPDASVAPLQPAANLRTPSRPVALPAAPTDLPASVNRLEAAPATPATATLPRPADLRALPSPATTLALDAELPAPVRRLEAAAAEGAATPLPRPAELRATTTASPSLAPDTPLPSPVQRLEAPTADGATVTPLARSNELRAPVPAAAVTELHGARDLPAPARRLESADGGSSVTPLQPAPNARAAAAAPGAATLAELSGALPGQVNAPAGPARGDPTANPTANPYAAPKASAGSPNAGSRLGPDLPAPPIPSIAPTAAASAPARTPLNLSLPRGDMSAKRGTGLIDLIPPPPERKSKLEQAMEDATNKDCRKAYAGAGILAVVPLALDAARGKGCNW
ncbi:hypothetical protein [Roseateles sp.]|uniref:hypothetical protein n=1 Tax=Roseateles sp. TaxID=1971397 RepID=UPI0032649DA6